MFSANLSILIATIDSRVKVFPYFRDFEQNSAHFSFFLILNLILVINGSFPGILEGDTSISELQMYAIQ